MKKLILALSLLLIGANSQAAFTEFKNDAIDPTPWKAIYAGEYQLDGMNVIVALESSEQEVVIPQVEAGMFQTVLPMAPIVKKVYRLKIVSSAQPELSVSYALISELSNEDGRISRIYRSKNAGSVEVFINTQEGDTVLVQMTRKNLEGVAQQISFELAPMVHVLKK